MILKTAELRDTLKELFEALLNKKAYYLEAPQGAEYPYIVFEPSRLTSEYGVEKYDLEINAWDSYATASRIDALMDTLESGIDKYKHYDKSRTFVIHKGNRQYVSDEDKKIKRVRENFELTVVERR